jgi:hypothetical protein
MCLHGDRRLVRHFFTGFIGNANASQMQTPAGVKFTASSLNDSMSCNEIKVSFGSVGLGRRTRAWSLDNYYFAYAGS